MGLRKRSSAFQVPDSSSSLGSVAGFGHCLHSLAVDKTTPFYSWATLHGFLLLLCHEELTDILQLYLTDIHVDD